MASELKLSLRNDHAEMDRLLRSFETFAEENALPPGARSTFHMALDEMVSNTIKYGYDDDGEHQIDVLLSVRDGSIVAEIIDDGHEFDPLSRDEPDTSLGIDERSIGGLGVHLVKEMTDEQVYSRRDGRNHLVLKKKI